MILLIVLICISVYISGWVYAFKCIHKASDYEDAPELGFYAAFFGLFFIPIAMYYIEYYEPSPKKPKPIRDDSDLLNAILTHSEIDDQGRFVVGGDLIQIKDTYVIIGDINMTIEFSKEALDKIRKQYLLLKITK
jgi:hypothetical protein